MIALTPEQLQAYVDAVYEVQMDGTWVAAAKLGGSDQRACLALISACNPCSQRLAEAENERRQQQLQAELDQGGWRWWPARGRSPDCTWVEAGFLVQAPITSIDRWACAYGQHAVWLAPTARSVAKLRIYSTFPVDPAPKRMANLQLEWVGCDPPFPA